MSMARQVRPEVPHGEDTVFYRGWEAGWEQMLDFFTGEGYRAYKGGCDLDSQTVSAGTWSDLLDAIDEEEDE